VNTEVAALVGLRRRRHTMVDASDVSGKDARAGAGRLAIPIVDVSSADNDAFFGQVRR
jgi:hypothetical protein